MGIHLYRVTDGEGKPLTKSQFEKTLKKYFPGSEKPFMGGYPVRDHTVYIELGKNENHYTKALIVGKDVSSIVSEFEEKAGLKFEEVHKK